MKHSSRTISLMGIFGALIILQAYIPMVGYIRIFPAWPAISTIHLTVILGGVLLGIPGGAGEGGELPFAFEDLARHRKIVARVRAAHAGSHRTG